MRLHLRSDTKLAQGQKEWEEEQGGLEFLREVSLVSASVAAKAAEWGSLVTAEVENRLVKPNCLEVARREAKRQLFRRREEAVARDASSILCPRDNPPGGHGLGTRRDWWRTSQ